MNFLFRYSVIRWLPLSRKARISVFERIADRDYRKRIEAARVDKGSANIAEIRQEHENDMYMLYQDREVLHTKHLLRAARRLRVPTPLRYGDKLQPTDKWNQSWDGAWYLSEFGVQQLRSAIRKERRERAELRAHWVTWVAAATGVIGALTGLVAVWRNASP